MKKNTSMKKGITLIEIILAIVLIAIILGITIPKLMANSARAEIKAVISSDIKSIVEATALWRKSNRSARGSFTNLNNSEIDSRLPNTMRRDAVLGVIESSGLRTGINDVNGQATGVNYYVTWAFSTIINTTTNGLGTPTIAFSLVMNTNNGINLLNWDSKLQAYANEVFQNTVAELTVPSSVNGALGSYNYKTAQSISFNTGVSGNTDTVDCTVENFQCANLILINQ